MAKLTKHQIDQQDFVGNQIFELLQKFIPPSKQIAWGIEAIGAIRDAISKQIVGKKFISEMQFYPYLKI